MMKEAKRIDISCIVALSAFAAYPIMFYKKSTAGIACPVVLLVTGKQLTWQKKLKTDELLKR